VGHQIWACLTLEKLIEDGHEIVGVVTEKDSFDDESYKRMAKYDCYCSLKGTAESLGRTVYQPNNVNSEDFIKVLDSLNPELIVMISYHTIIQKPLLDRYTIINAHGAPLPRYRGRAPINWAIINGEGESAVTVHFVNEGIDTGDIIYQKKVKIKEMDTSIDVLKRSLPFYPKLVSKAVKAIERGNPPRIPQNSFEGTYFPTRRPEDGLISWDRDSRDINNLIRALAKPFPGAFTFHKGKKIIVWESGLPPIKTRISPVPGIIFGKTEKGEIKVTTKDSYIILGKIQPVEANEIVPTDYFKMGSKLGT